MDNRHNFKIISQVKSPRINFSEGKGNYIQYGNNNRFPYELINYYNNSSIHATCINAIIDSIVGEGLISDSQEIDDFINSDGDTLNIIFNKCAFDYYLYGGYSLEIIWNKSKTKITFYHIPFNYIRAKKKDFRGKIDGYYLSNEWDKVKPTLDILKDYPYLPTFDPAKKQLNSIFVKKTYRPGQEYYPLPAYNAALRVLELDLEIDNFHVNNIKNGLKPSLSVTTFLDGNKEQLEEVEKQLNDNYGGSDNAGSMIYMDVADPEKAPVIVPIQQNGNDSYYVDINDMTTKKILTAHRITSPMLLGIKDSTGLGNNAEELQTSYELFLQMVIRPLQKQILSGFEELLLINDPTLQLGIKNIVLFAEENEEDVEVVTGLDSEDNVDKSLEKDINSTVV